MVASETMERETPAEGAARRNPGAGSSSLLGPRREGGAAADAEASKPDIEQAAGEAVASIEFIGLWNENKEKDDLAMPVKFKVAYQEGYNDIVGIRVAFSRFRTTSTSSFEPPWKRRQAAFSRSQI